MEVAVAQLDPVAGDVDRNLEAALETVADAADAGADLVVLPEQFAVGFFAFEAYAESAEPVGGRVTGRLATAAAEHGIAVLAGSVVEDLAATAATTALPVPAESGLANTSVLYDAEGTRRAVYRKTHLWGYDSREAELLVPGERLGVADLGGLTVGVATCYDLRFPELFRAYAARGVDLFCVPSAWPFPRVEHWRTLSRSRAVENLAYVATANGVGEMGDERLCGRSTVYDPWGTVLAAGADGPTLLTATADPETVGAVREEFPSLRDRRPEAGWR